MVGKLLNAGQTCIAPDYALVPQVSVDAFVAAIERATVKLYPSLATNPDYTAIVNERHYRRLTALVDDGAWAAAGTSFVLFAGGAIVPVAPFLFLTGASAVIVSPLVSALPLFLIGAAITLVTGRNVLSTGLRQLLFGAAAAGVTYGIGRLIGVTLAG